jgi:plasmid stabilization system protein ParE
MNYPRLPAIVTPRAKAKLLEQRDWYNRQEEGLGDRFYSEILEAIAYLEENYLVPPRDRNSEGVRRHINRGSFPWLIYYRVLDDQLVIASFSHPKERPIRKRG